MPRRYYWNETEIEDDVPPDWPTQRGNYFKRSCTCKRTFRASKSRKRERCLEGTVLYISTLWKVSEYGLLVHSFSYSNWLQVNKDQKKLRVWTLLRQYRYSELDRFHKNLFLFVPCEKYLRFRHSVVWLSFSVRCIYNVT